MAIASDGDRVRWRLRRIATRQMATTSDGHGDPQYSNQAKDKPVSSEVANAVSTVVSDKVGQYLEQHAKEACSIINKAVVASRGPPRDGVGGEFVGDGVR
jgi:DNA gyrase/topoisomerase IV subunit B